MKDYAGNELEVGMRVLICVPSYKHLVWAVVEKINPQTVTCSYERRKDYRNSVPRLPNQVVVPVMPKRPMTTEEYLASYDD